MPARIWRCTTARSFDHGAADRPGLLVARRGGRSRPPRQRPAALTKDRSEYRVVGHNAPRVDLAAKVFGEPVFVHDMALDGMVHARVVRQPRRGATIASIDEAAIRRAAKGPIEIIRDGNFLAVAGRR